MTKKVLAVLLSLLLLCGAAPLAFASPAEDGWLIYYTRTEETAFTAVIVAPAKYTRVSDHPQIEFMNTADPAESGVLAATAEQIPFSFGGKTEPCWTLTVEGTLPAGSFPGHFVTCAVLPGSLSDAAGNANARILFDDEVEYREAAGVAEIDVYSALLQEDYDPGADTVGVGDTLRVDYSGLYPVEILVNGEAVAAFPGGEMQRYTCAVTETGALDVAVRQNGKDLAARPMTVVTSKEMYKRNLRDSLLFSGLPTVEDYVEAGVPRFSLYIPLFTVAAFFVELRDFFYRLGSFSRITE